MAHVSTLLLPSPRLGQARLLRRGCGKLKSEAKMRRAAGKEGKRCLRRCAGEMQKEFVDGDSLLSRLSCVPATGAFFYFFAALLRSPFPSRSVRVVCVRTVLPYPSFVVRARSLGFVRFVLGCLILARACGLHYFPYCNEGMRVVCSRSLFRSAAVLVSAASLTSTSWFNRWREKQGRQGN